MLWIHWESTSAAAAAAISVTSIVDGDRIVAFAAVLSPLQSASVQLLTMLLLLIDPLLLLLLLLLLSIQNSDLEFGT